MARIKGAVTTRARRKRVLKRAKGYFGAKSIRFKITNNPKNNNPIFNPSINPFFEALIPSIIPNVKNIITIAIMIKIDVIL